MRLALRLLVVVASATLANAQACSKSKECDTPSCCSRWGNCGFGPEFCGNGCQNGCDNKPECGKYALDFDCPLRVCCSKWGYCGTTEEFCNNECQGNCEQPPAPSCSSAQRSQKQVSIGYYASWAATRKCEQFTVDHIEPNLYTHLNYAFVDVRNGVIAPLSAEESQNLKNFAALKELNPSLKVLISVGGWAFNDPGPTQQEFHNIAKDRQSRDKFIQSVKQFLDEYDFDGIDIDWEYPAAEDRGGSPEDKENYLSLVKDMRRVFRRRYLITIAAPASYWYLRHFEISEMAQHLDWINVMTYDIHGVWDAEIESLGPYVRPHTDITEIEPAIGLFAKDGVPYDKLVLGLGYYGRAFKLEDPNCYDIGCKFSGPADAGECTDAPRTLAWFEIERLKELKPDARQISNSTGQVRILVFERDQWVGYDDEETLEFKRNWARDNCMKGTMIWSIDQGIVGYRRALPDKNNNYNHPTNSINNNNNIKYPSGDKGAAHNRNPAANPPIPQKNNQYGPAIPQKTNQYGTRFGKPRVEQGV